ncbi:hypothetical protein [Gaetbulibacter aestuarii]|uniref:SGNH/GDSL hydrolase family protein n=1 Tax=Gaetbulibacter aestuarii TaxID=1502358 RepID=A0ABW7MXS2_9FLAO
MKLKLSLFIAVSLTLAGIVCWELYWRSKPDEYKAVLEDDRYLWAEHRRKVETATAEDVVILGSSRTGFDFNTHVWEKTQGRKPINLAADGKPPRPFLEDIVYNTNFKGTLVIGITPLMWFSDPNDPWASGTKQWVEHYHNQTYAQKLGYVLSKPLERNLVFLTSSELEFYNDLDLKSLIGRIYIPGRGEEPFMLYNFSYHDEDRNLMMFPRMRTDPEFAKRVTDAWEKFLPYLPDYESVKNYIPQIIKDYVKTINDFKARGGKVIFIRHKSEEPWTKHAMRLLPKEKVWDRFVAAVNSPCYHYKDYEFMSRYTLPDWSHMYTDDAKLYTKDIVEKLIADGYLKKFN